MPGDEGCQVWRDEKLRDGLEVVLADGAILQTGGKAIKNVTGYDLTSLFTGSEGTLGIVTKALLRLIPMPKKRGTLQVMCRSLDDGCTTVHNMLQSGIVPAAAEIMDKICLDAVAKSRNMNLNPAIGACLVIEIDGEDDEALETQTKRIEAVAKACGAVEFHVASRSRNRMISGPSGGASVPPSAA